MIALLLTALLSCPLLAGGVLVYSTVQDQAVGYRVYIQNPSPFKFSVTNIELVLRADDGTYYPFPVKIPRQDVPAHGQVSVDLGPRADINPTQLAGSHIYCSVSTK